MEYLVFLYESSLFYLIWWRGQVDQWFKPQVLKWDKLGFELLVRELTI